MIEVLGTIGAFLAAIFGGVFWHRKQVANARKVEAADLKQKAAIVRVKLNAADKAIDKKTQQKIKNIRGKSKVWSNKAATTDAANELRDATRGDKWPI